MTALLQEIDLTGMLPELMVLKDSFEPEVDMATSPEEWLDSYLGEYAWELQRTIWRSVETRQNTAVISCNNSGKTWLAGRIVVRWVVQFWREGVRVVTTAPTAAQVTLLLWQEIRAAFNKATERKKNPPGRIITSPFPQWKIGDLTCAFGRKPADQAQSAMQGVHEKHVLVVLDEAGGLAETIWAAADKITTTGHCAILAIGNPDDPASKFAKITRPRSGWHTIRVDGLRTPNFTAEAMREFPLTRALMEHEGIPYNTEAIPEGMRPVMLQPKWVEGQLQKWCGVIPEVALSLDEDERGQYVADLAAKSQLFTAAIRGQFPENAGDSVIPLGWVMRAVERWHDWVAGGRVDTVGRRVTGTDVATPNGADETVVAVRQGWIVEALHVYPTADTVETVQNVKRHSVDIAQAVAVVDVTGVGAGVRDYLARDGVSTVRFIASGQDGRTDRHGQLAFANNRAAAWWHLRELLDPAYGARLAVPPDEDLITELTSTKWKIRGSRGKRQVVQIEPKADLKKRIGRSPDRADALIMSAWVDAAPAPPDHTQPGPEVPSPEEAALIRTTTVGVIPYADVDPSEGGW